MKAALLTALREIEIRDLPDPVLSGPRDVLVRMGRVGVCGSDIHYYTTGRIGCQVVEYPFAVGHEGAGVVAEVGREVTRVRPGDRVAIDPAISCGECDQCRAGRAHTCRNLRFLGCPGQVPGCLTEAIVMPEACCFPIPDSMTLEEATISEPLAIGVHAVRLAGDVAGRSIAILGSGPIGLSVLIAARARGVGRVLVTDKIPERLAVAREVGADATAHPDRGDVVGSFREMDPLGADVVFECCGKQEALDQAIELLRPGGSLLLVGIPEVPRVSFDIDILRRHEIRIQNVRRQNECVEETLELIARPETDVRSLVTHRYPLARCGEAFDLVAGYRDGVVKAMVELGGVE